jgi:hypothetical protein
MFSSQDPTLDILRQDGLNEQQITDVALAAVLRNFLCRFFDSPGVDPDPELIEKEPELWSYLKDWHKDMRNNHNSVRPAVQFRN